MKKSLLFLLLFGWGAVYGQDVKDPGLFKVFSLRIEGESGYLSGKSGYARMFDENTGYFGLNYTQNFSKAKWLALVLDAELTVRHAWAYAGINNPTDVARYWLNDQTFAAGLIFFNGFYVHMDSKGIMKMEAYYNFRLGKAHVLKPYVGLKVFYTGTKGIPLTSFTDNNGSPSINSPLAPVGAGSTLSEMWLGLSYSVSFAKDMFAFTTDLSYRSAGDNGETFKNSSAFRWDNTLSFMYEGVTLWGCVRYQPMGISKGGNDVFHSVMLRAGLNYAFDFAKL